MNSSKVSRLAARMGIYILGLMVLAFAIALSVNCNLGVSPVSSLPYVVSQMILGGKKFQPALLLQLVFVTVFGYFTDTAKYLLGDFMLPGYLGQLVMLAVSIGLLSLSIVLYVDVKIVPMPAEGLVACISEKFGKPFSTVKMCFDCTSVAVGLTLCLLFLGKVVGIREGTVITAVLVGKLTGLIRKLISPLASEGLLWKIGKKQNCSPLGTRLAERTPALTRMRGTEGYGRKMTSTGTRPVDALFKAW